MRSAFGCGLGLVLLALGGCGGDEAQGTVCDPQDLACRPASCGNGTLDPGELCDGAALGGASCESQGLGGGALTCAANCAAFDTSACSSAPGCTPKTCADDLCGTLDDGCGGTLTCADRCDAIEPWYTCGAREPNRCGATCSVACPAGSTCDDQGVCVYASPLTVPLDVHDVRLQILRDGQLPTETCSPGEPIASLLVARQDVLATPARATVLCGTGLTSTPLQLPSGVYDVTVQATGGRVDLPAMPLTTQVSVEGAGQVPVRLGFATVRGRLTLGGAAPTESNCTEGATVGTVNFTQTVSMRPYTFSAPVLCGGGFAFASSLYPGTYTVTWTGTAERSNLPPTHLFSAQFELNAGTSDHVFDVGQHAVVSGELLRGGGPLVPTRACTQSYHRGPRLSVSNKLTQAEVATVVFPCGGPYTFALPLPPGTYSSIVVNGDDTGDIRHFPDDLVVADAPVRFDVTLPAVATITGKILFEGQTPVETEACTGELGAVWFPDGALTRVQCGQGLRFGPRETVVGTYPVSFTPYTGMTNAMTGTALMTIPPAGGELTFDFLRKNTANIRFSIDGQPLSDAGCTPDNAVATVTLSSPNFIAWMPLLCGRQGVLTAEVEPGEYRVAIAPNGAVPLPMWLGPQPITLGAGNTVAVDIPTARLSGSLVMNGAPPVETEACSQGETVAELIVAALAPTDSRIAVEQRVPVPCGGQGAFGPVTVGKGIVSLSVVGNPGMSNLPNYPIVVVPRLRLP